MQNTNNKQWLWRVTQAISFFVQRSVFSWALPAGVRIPSNASSFCWFVTQVLSCCRLSAFFVCLLFCFGKACWEWYSVLKRASERGDFVSAHRGSHTDHGKQCQPSVGLSCSQYCDNCVEILQRLSIVRYRSNARSKHHRDTATSPLVSAQTSTTNASCLFTRRIVHSEAGLHKT